MIIEWLIGVGAAIAGWASTLWPASWAVPSELLNLDDTVNGFFSMFSGFGPWVDWQFVGVVAAIPPAIWAGGLLVKVVRAAVTHLPWIGGKG